jgi:hypothetical protein
MNATIDRRDQAWDEHKESELLRLLEIIRQKCGAVIATAFHDTARYSFIQGYHIGIDHGLSDAQRTVETFKPEAIQ